MITIVRKNSTPPGWYEYEIRFKREVVAKFQHRGGDSLDKYFRLAANAVQQENKRRKQLREYILSLSKKTQTKEA